MEERAHAEQGVLTLLCSTSIVPWSPASFINPWEGWASRKLDHRSSVIWKRTCVTLAVCPLGRVTAPNASHHASVGAACVPIPACATPPLRPGTEGSGGARSEGC